MTTTLGEALLHALKEHGAREIFALPGDFVLAFFHMIEKYNLLPVKLLSHEPGVGFAADGAARFSRSIGVAVVTYGAGALNMVNAIASAYAERSPVVVISGAPGKGESRRGLLLHHQAKTLDSQFQIYKEITCDQVKLDDAQRAPADIARVLAACIRQSRPVYIELPRDMVTAPCTKVTRLMSIAHDTNACAACVEEILKRISSASQPILMLGVEVHRYGLEDKVESLARRLGLPVVTSFMDHGLLARCDIPAYLGAAGSSELSLRIETSDALVLLGVVMSDTNFGMSQQTIDIRNTVQAVEGHVWLANHMYNDIPLVALIDGLLCANVPDSLTNRAIPFVPIVNQRYAHSLLADDHAISPSDIAAAIDDAMVVHGRMPIVVDVGECLFTAQEIDNTATLLPGYYASNGFAVPAAIGMQVRSGMRPLVLVGDGAFQMTGMELCNCRRLAVDPIIIVFNNACWAALVAFDCCNSNSLQIEQLRYDQLAITLGGDGVRVNTRKELRNSLEKAWMNTGRFQLIDVVLQPGVNSTTLSRFLTTMSANSKKSNCKSI